MAPRPFERSRSCARAAFGISSRAMNLTRESALAAFYGARYAKKLGVPLNVAFLWEFEEEIGSPNFEATIAKHKSLLATKSVIVSDTIWISRERPAAPAGLRGLQGMLLRLRTGK